MWKLETNQRYVRRLHKLEKKHRRELEAVSDNLDTYFVSLNQGAKPMQLVQKESFIHNERQGIYAVDQSPLKKGFKALRLYVYPDTEACTLHIITIGDKKTQSSDVNECFGYLKEIQKEKEDRGGST